MKKDMIRIYDIDKLPFGTHISVKTLNGTIECAVSIIGAIAFNDGMILDFEEVSSMEVYLGWV